jgi:sugar lactone lactonase YvrE
MKTFLSAAIIAVSVFIVTGFGQDVWTVNNRTDILKGDARGVSIDEAGAISLSPRLTELFNTGQPFIWSSVVDAQGNIYLGTGSEARIYRVTPAGQGALYADLEGLNVSAMAIGRSGELYAATSPDGKVYRINAGGTPEVFFDPEEKYIWSLALMSDGSLAVGTGEGGKIFRVRSAGAAPAASLIFDSSETHIVSLAVSPSGDLYAGTDPGGIVLRFGSDGRPSR